MFTVLVLIEAEIINTALISFTDFNELSLIVGQELGLVLEEGFNLFFYPISNTCKFSPECLPRVLFTADSEILLLVGLGYGSWQDQYTLLMAI